MKKLFTSIFLFSLCTLLSAQNILNVNGNIFNTDGSVAAGVYVSLTLDNDDASIFNETDSEGYFEFTVDVGDITQGCFELYYLDCIFEIDVVQECYHPGNMDFTYSFIYCESGSNSCFAIIYPETTDSAIVLSVLPQGVEPFTYLWSDGSTNETLVLPVDVEGEFCVEVTDAEGCVAENCIDLTPPEPCFVWFFQEQNWNSTLLIAEGYGQTDEVEYTWSTGETSPVIEVAESAEYCVTLSDGLGCESVDCQYVQIDTSSNEDCFAFIYQDFENDSIDVLYVEVFGVAPFTYVWSIGDSIISTDGFLFPQEQGTYCVTVTDANNCEATTCYDFFVWEDCGVWVGCDPLDDGSIQLFAFGYGAEPITYEWNNGYIGQELIVTENGEYCVTITDAEGCTSSSCITVNTDVVECFVPIDVEIFDGYAELSLNITNDMEYEVVWFDGQTGYSIIVQESGFYCVEVLEVATGCTFSTCATVVLDEEDCWGYIETQYVDDSTAILTVIASNTSSDSFDYQYIWSNGDVMPSITVTTEGTYCVTVSSSNNCVFVTCTDITFWDAPSNTMVGGVFDEVTGELVDADISLYTLLDDGTVELYTDAEETLIEGFFFIENIASGSYIVLATAEDGDYAPTYSFSTTSWEEAEIYNLDVNNTFVSVEISMVTINNLVGNGSIEGAVTIDNLVANNKDTGSRSSDPLEGANIMLMHSGLHVGQMFTDADGHYKFLGLPDGTYEVVLEIPGLPRKIIEVTLSEDNPNATDVDFEAEDTSTATNNISTLSALTLGPNPTTNNLVLNAQFTDREDLIYRIVDMNGRIVITHSTTTTIGENRIAIDVSTLGNGVYNMILQTSDELMAKRFIKM